MAADRSRLPPLGPERPFTFPQIRRTTLESGLRVWTVEHRQVPLVAILAIVPVGASSDPADRPGLAAITGDMLDEGAGDRWRSMCTKRSGRTQARCRSRPRRDRARDDDARALPRGLSSRATSSARDSAARVRSGHDPG
jgi:hypothetical protein